ncbi:hypothetical protein AC31_5651, partial [Escherichia coli 3-073-06_S3_C2]
MQIRCTHHIQTVTVFCVALHEQILFKGVQIFDQPEFHPFFPQCNQLERHNLRRHDILTGPDGSTVIGQFVARETLRDKGAQ